MPWIRRSLRGAKVFVRATADGRPLVDGRGLVDVVYRLGPEAKVYRASAQNLVATGDPGDDTLLDDTPAAAPAPRRSRAATVPVDDAPGAPLIVYTDGACTGNPGPMGIGVVILDGKTRRELSDYLGTGTNNIAELTAIERALEAIAPDERARPVRVHSDSGYSIGLLSQGWKAKANAELVARLRKLVAEFPRLTFVKVAGHAGVPENERCDELAREAIIKRRGRSGKPE
jgi:ribonuclease HI